MEIVFQILLYVFAGVFAVLALGLCLAYYHKRHSGLLLMAITYGAAAGGAIALMQWWPLMAGFVAVWAIRLMGLDPETDSDEAR